MPISQSGGSLVTGSSIVDGTVSNADIASNAAIALSKLANLIGNPGDLISIETGTGSTYSLTTIAGQKVLVLVKGNVADNSTESTTTLTYNSVTKDTVKCDGDAGSNLPFTLGWTDVPGADTQTLSVQNSIVAVENVVWFIIKLQVA